MANLGNLIVRGVTRILGDAYANKFIGNLQGNADTATSAIKASTADSATNATSANKASIATAVQDYGTSDYREIKIGYLGSGLSSSDITHAVGFTDSGTKLKDISKDEFRNWLATASGTWPITVSNSSNSANADKLDGYHKNDILRSTVAPTSVISLNDVVTEGIDFTSWDYAHSANVNNQPGGNGASSAASVVSFGTDYPFQIYSDYNDTSYLYYRSFYSNTGWKDWRQFAFLDSNVASASKWANARTITLTGSVTGSVSIDGSQNVSLATTTNHTHNYAGSSSAGGSANSALTLLYNNILDTNYGNYVVFQQFAGQREFPHLGWFNSIKMLHNNSAGYFTEIAMSFTGEDGIWRRALRGGGEVGWYKMLDSGNYNSYSPKLDGTGASGTWGINISGTADSASYAAVLLPISKPTTNTSASDKPFSYFVGQPAIGAAEGNAYAGSSNDYNLLSFPTEGTVYDSTYANVMTLRLSWDKSKYWHDIFASPNTKFLWHRCVQGGTAYDWCRIVEEATDRTWDINISGNAATATNANAVNGVSLTWDGEITSSQWIAAWESGTSIRTMSAYNTFISMCSYLDEGSSDVTDGTMFITSYATDNGFADPNGKNKPYKRKASFLWNYINNKCSSIYATQSWVNSNYYTCSESDSRYIQSETDPVWTAAKGNYYTKTECNNRYIQSETDPVWTAAKENYYTKTECNNKFQPKGTYLTEQNLQGYATQEWVRGEEYLYRSGGTMDARAEIGITTKLFIGNSTSPDTCYTKFNCVLHGGGDESNPNWIIRDNGYSEFKSSVSANAFYASSDIRLKNILDDINIDFDKLKLIPKKYYTWKGSDILQLGTIAQDIQKIYPEVVSKNENGYLSVDYSKLSIIALAAIDKLNERIKELECQIKL